MSRTILCTTGTSIAQGCKALGDYQRRASVWEETTSELTEQIRERLKALDLTAESGRVRASAELNALQRLHVLPDDEVVLLATDTADGRACAEAVRDVLSKHFGISKVGIDRITGLQVRDADTLRRVGLANLSRRLVHYLDDPQRRYGGGCVLCPNGGFKGIVPFLTILGMIYRAPVVYVFEFAETLINLPPLPIGFATDLFDRALPALRWAVAEGVFNVEDFHRRIPGFTEGDREWFDSFLEVSPDVGDRVLASLSPLAEVLAQREGSAESVLMLSPMARSELDRLVGQDLKEVTDLLRKLSSPLWRSQHRDTKYTNNLEFYPRGHNPWRFAGFVEADVFHLCWFARHDEYERRLPLPTMQRGGFAPVDFARFVVPISAQPVVVEGDPDAGKDWEEIRRERDAANATMEEQARSISEFKEKLTRREAVIQNLRADLEFHKNTSGAMKPVRKGGSLFEKPDPSLIDLVANATVAGSKKTSYTLHLNHNGKKIRLMLDALGLRQLSQGEVVAVRITGVSTKMAHCVMEGLGHPLPEQD